MTDGGLGPARSALKKGFLTAIVFSLALNLLVLSVPLYMVSIYERVLTARSQETLLVLTVAALAAVAVAAALEVVRRLVLTRIAAALETALGGDVLAASLRTASRESDEIQGLRDLALIRQFVASPVTIALLDAPVAPLYLALLYLIHPHLGWLSLAAAVLIVLLALLNQKLTQVPLAAASRNAASSFRSAQAHARNAEIVHSMGMFGNCVLSWGEDSARALIATEQAARRNALLNGLTYFVRLSLQIGVLGYGAYLVLLDNSLGAGIIFAASVISGRALAPLNHAIGGWSSVLSARRAWRRTVGALAGERPMPMPLPAPRASLSVEKLFYRPSLAAGPILKGLTFAIEPGDMVAVIGPSGAGKSTLARLLVGALRPSSGTVRIGGDDLANWDSDALGPWIGFLPQDVDLLPATVARNIARLDPAPDPRKVVEAAQLANCHELIQRLPQGYDTLLGPEGCQLSGGQRQRIALARAFYGDPRVVVLDEPNAFLDNEGEQALLAALNQARAAGITCVVVTQRTSVLPALSKMLVLRDGQQEAFGPKDEIVPRCRPAATAPAYSMLSPVSVKFG